MQNKKRVPPPPNSKRVPLPPAPKLPSKIFQQSQNQQNPLSQIQQKIDGLPQINDSTLIETKTFLSVQHLIKEEVVSVSYHQEVKDGIQNVQKEIKNISNEIQLQSQILQNNQSKGIQSRLPPSIKGVPQPPKSRNASSQQKKRLAPPKIPSQNFLSKTQQQIEKKDRQVQYITGQLTKDSTEGIQNQSNQPYQIKNQDQIVSENNEIKNQKQEVSPEKSFPIEQSQQKMTKSELQSRKEQNNSQKILLKSIPPSTNSGSKRLPTQIKPPVKPSKAIKNIEISPLKESIKQNQLFSNDQQIKIENFEGYQKQRSPQISIVQQNSLKPSQQVQLSQKVQKTETKVGLSDKKQKKHGKNEEFSKQDRGSEFKNKDQVQQPTQYSELQEKLRRLQQLRSRMDQSSQESYQNQQDEIQQEEQLQISQNKSQQEEINKDSIFILGERNLSEDEIQQEKKQVNSNFEEFAIGQTNYQQMEIKQQIQETERKVENIEKDTQNQNEDLENNIFSSSSPEEQSESIVPIAAQTVYESNLSVQQSRRKYLPDQLSISPLNSQQSMAKHHQFPHDPINNVEHADKYRSQANFDKPKNFIQNDQQIQKNSKVYERTISQKSDQQPSKLKCHSSKNQHHYIIRDQSIETNFDKQSIDNEQQNMKENQQPKINAAKINVNAQKTKQKTTQKNIEELLKQFRTKKTSYLQNIENLKMKQQKFYEEEGKYRQKIDRLIEQVNHKNLLILTHTPQLSVQNLRIDRQIQSQEL